MLSIGPRSYQSTPGGEFQRDGLWLYLEVGFKLEKRLGESIQRRSGIKKIFIMHVRLC